MGSRDEAATGVGSGKEGQTMSFVRGLECKECGAAYAVEPRMICDACFGPVEVTYDYEALARTVTRESIEAGPASLWRQALPRYRPSQFPRRCARKR